MAKVFTITAGLENMGAMKTGGQGSVYKGRRIGELISAIKILPTPIYSESDDDRNYTVFQNEVQKLKRVNEEPNPHVVSILSSGITETGNLPFIEMEYIDGPDLEELLKPPHEPIFTIKETLKVAEQLADALAHCHRLDVRHGDIKSNNVKYSRHTGNYILLDFGLSIMSDEQRRTSLRQAGAIEFMAPEQNEGLMLFETDVYSFGVILFELLTGTVPFPLVGKGENARNEVRLAHMQAPVPRMLPLRRDKVGHTQWNQRKKDHEVSIPNWLETLVYKCLEKNAADRFSNGMALHEYIVQNSTTSGGNGTALQQQVEQLAIVNEQLGKEKSMAVKSMEHYRAMIESRERDLEELKEILRRKDEQLTALESGPQLQKSNASGGSKLLLFVLILIAGLAGYAAYTTFIKPQRNSRIADNRPTTKRNTTSSEKTPERRAKDTVQVTNPQETKRIPQPKKETPAEPIATKRAEVPADTAANNTNNPAQEEVAENETPPTTPENNAGRARRAGLYTVDSKAFFHNEPDETTRRAAFINKWNNAVLAALDDRNGFIYVVYTNAEGQTSRGWLRKQDLTPVKTLR